MYTFLLFRTTFYLVYVFKTKSFSCVLSLERQLFEFISTVFFAQYLCDSKIPLFRNTISKMNLLKSQCHLVDCSPPVLNCLLLVFALSPSLSVEC